MKRKIAYRPQRDVMGCGAACLSMITSYYGNTLPLDFISSQCGMTAHGVSLLSIVKTARSIGFEALGIKSDLTHLHSIPLPCILHWDQNHFVVLSKINSEGDEFEIIDPGEGRICLSLDRFRNHWLGEDSNLSSKGILMALKPTDRFFGIIKEEEKRKNLLPSVVVKYLRLYKKSVFVIVVTLALGCVLQLIAPFLTQWIVDKGIKHKDIGLIWAILLGELFIVFGRTVAVFIRRWMLLHISMRINISLVSDFLIKLLKLPMSFFETRLMGDILQRINDHSRVQTFLTNQLLDLIFTFLSFLIFGIVLLSYDNIVFLIFLVGSLLYGLWMASFLSRRKIIDYDLFGLESVNRDRTYQFVTSMQEIKLQDCERRRRWEWEDTQADLFAVQMKSLKLQQTQEAGSVFINEIKNILITVFAATAVIDGQLTLGAMLAIQYIVGQLNTPVEQLMQFVYSMQDVKISLERINEIHDSEEESKENNRRNFPGGKSIEVDNVDFKYDRHALKNTLEGASFTVPAGKVTAIVGASGSGKTTLIKLMLGYYPVLGGEIRVSGKDINGYDLKWWRRHCGVVMQDGVIFSESIARNIAVDDGDIDAAKMESAARIACIHDYVMSLPLKYDTRIGRDGMGLSQGQKQRILIARAVYKDPDFIFLDEATNALDAKNERGIVENLEKFYKGRTVVVVAHRLSTVRNAARIVVIDGGRVVEIGRHDELINKRGTYYNLVKNQLELGN